MLPEISEHEAAQLAQRLCQTVESSTCEHDGQSIGITVSIGAVSGLGAGQFNLDTVLKSADLALYKAKEAGRNRVVRAAT